VRKTILAVVALFTGLVALNGTALAVDVRYKPVPKMKLSPNFQMPQIAPEESDPSAQTMQQLCNGCLEAQQNARTARRELRRKSRQCRNEDYTQADQAAAGCSPSDTVAQCNSKLFSRCVKAERDKANAAGSQVVRTCSPLVERLKQTMSQYQQN
jgi:hypothetical protein